MAPAEKTSIEKSPKEIELLCAYLESERTRHAGGGKLAIPRGELHLWTVPDGEIGAPGRKALRRILSLYLGIEPEPILLEEGLLGKPMIESSMSAGRIRFNCSHCGPWSVYAVTRGREVGVDIEKTGSVPLEETALRRVFSPGELEVFRMLPQAKLDEAFLSCWTRKEALLKAAGTGLFVEPSEIEVSFAPGSRPVVLSLPQYFGPAAGWSLADIETIPGYRGALAVEGPLPLIKRPRFAVRETAISGIF